MCSVVTMANQKHNPTVGFKTHVPSKSLISPNKRNIFASKKKMVFMKIVDYVVKSLTQPIIGLGIRTLFWTGLIAMGPTSSLAIIGPRVLLASTVVVHSGLIEYAIVKAI